MSWGKPVETPCPRCGKFMVIKGKKVACSDEQCGYVEDFQEKSIELSEK